MEDSYLSYIKTTNNNNNLKFDISYFYNLDSENKICFDCGGAFPRFISINNGVFICNLCAENHKRNLNFNISYVLEVNSEFDQYLLSYITRGGNSRFKRLCNQYEVLCMSLSQNNSEKINKYIIRLGEYHRLVLKSEINCSEPPPPLYREVAHNPIDINILYFPEFENYILFKGNNIANSKNNVNNNNINVFNNNTNNLDESMTSKIWEGTKSTFDIMKTTTGFIYKTGKPIVSFLGNAAFTGLKYLGNSVWNYMSNNENNDNNKDGNNNNINTIGNNTPLNNNFNDINYNNNGNTNNNFNNNYNNNNSNYYRNNKNYLTNSNKFTIFTINEDKTSNNNIIQNNQNNYYSKPIPNINNINNSNKENKIPNFYDINSINNESINNISFYLNNNNNNNSINDISKSKLNLLNHKNIIINNKYINNKSIKYNNNIIENTPDLPNKSKVDMSNISLPNNNYPNYSLFEKNNNMIINKNVPNIIGEEIYQEEAKYPIYQSTNLLNQNSFTPSEFHTNNED